MIDFIMVVVVVQFVRQFVISSLPTWFFVELLECYLKLLSIVVVIYILANLDLSLLASLAAPSTTTAACEKASDTAFWH